MHATVRRVALRARGEPVVLGQAEAGRGGVFVVGVDGGAALAVDGHVEQVGWPVQRTGLDGLVERQAIAQAKEQDAVAPDAGHAVESVQHMEQARLVVQELARLPGAGKLAHGCGEVRVVGCIRLVVPVQDQGIEPPRLSRCSGDDAPGDVLPAVRTVVVGIGQRLGIACRIVHIAPPVEHDTQHGSQRRPRA